MVFEDESTELLTERSVEDLLDMRLLTVREQIVVPDLQFLLGWEGEVVANDPIRRMERGANGTLEIDRLLYKAFEQLLRRGGIEPGVPYTADALEFRIRAGVGHEAWDEAWDGFLNDASQGPNRVLEYNEAADRYTLLPQRPPRRRPQ